LTHREVTIHDDHFPRAEAEALAGAAAVANATGTPAPANCSGFGPSARQPD